MIPIVCCCGCIDSSQSLSLEGSEGTNVHPGKAIYDDYCFSCHTPGLNGAPRIGDEEVWTARLAQGRGGLAAIDYRRYSAGHAPKRYLF